MRKVIIDGESLKNPICVQNIITAAQSEFTRKEVMYDYYKGENKGIKKKTTSNTVVDVNNQIPIPISSTITNTIVGYFVGNPVTYKARDNEEVDEELNAILEENDVHSLDTEAAKNASIYGYSCEYYYITPEGKFDVSTIDPKECIACYSGEAENNLTGVIRKYNTVDWTVGAGNLNYFVDVFTVESIYHYKGDGTFNGLTLIGVDDNIWGDVPFTIYRNSTDLRGDYEKVIPLIDALDYMISNHIDSFRCSIDNFLVMTGVHFNDEGDKEQFIKDMQNRIIFLEGLDAEVNKTDAKFISSNTQESLVEFTIKELKRLIYTTSQCVDLSDDNLGGNISGIGIRFKTLPMENLCSTKENLFKEGLQRRNKFILQYISTTNTTATDCIIDIQMTRNIPVNDSENADMLLKYKQLGVSDDTLLANIPIVTDVQFELDKSFKNEMLQVELDKSKNNNLEEE